MKFENENFSFEVFIEGTVANAIKNLPTGVSNDILVSIMKESVCVSFELTAQN